jgi:hypothetical protein
MKKFYLADSFLKECGKSKPFRIDNAKNLIRELGGGSIVDDLEGADSVLCGVGDNSAYACQGKRTFTWPQFLDLIPTPPAKNVDLTNSC